MENQPPTAIERSERSEDANLISQGLYNQPNEEITIDSTNEGAAHKINNVLYECDLCNFSFSSFNKLRDHQSRTHLFISFLCWICRQNLRMSHKNMKEHFIAHEIHFCRQTKLRKIKSNDIFNMYHRSFDDEEYWPYNPFMDDDMNDLIKMIKINASIKERIIVNISCKMWFEPKAALEGESPQFIWMSIPSIQVDQNEIQLNSKIRNSAEQFFNIFLEQESVNDSGSGYAYYAVSDIKLKCIKNMQFGCRIENANHQKLISQLVSTGVVFNPLNEWGCFHQCVYKHFSGKELTYLDNEVLSTINKATVSFHDLENLPFTSLSFGVRILYLVDFGNEHFGVQCIFTSTNFHSKLEKINLLAICSDSADTAHFVLIQKLNLFMQYIFKQGKKKQKRCFYFCQFCLQKKSRTKKVINEHELFCLSNPEKNREKRQISQNLNNFLNTIHFSEEQKYLKCKNKGRVAPNFYGFLDFETVFSSARDSYSQIQVCRKHRMEGISYCVCPQTIKSDTIESLSYSLIIIDFHTNKIVFEKYYVQKNEQNEKAGEHLVATLLQLAYAISLINSINYPIDMTLEQKLKHMKATNCAECGRSFCPAPTSEKELFNSTTRELESAKIAVNCKVKLVKTAHHVHHLKNDNYVSSLCSKCNLAIQSRYQSVPIFCHNFSRFDHVFLLKGICRLWGNTKMSILSKSENNIMCIKANPFELKDSYNFISGSLDGNIELVKKSCKTQCKNCSIQNQCSICQQKTEENLKQVFSLIYNSDLSKVNGLFSLERFNHNLKKSAFPYQLLTNYEDLFLMTSFPKHADFFSILKGKNVDMEEYNSAKQYFDTYCSNMSDFLQIYNRLDTYLLCAVWRVMADILKEKLDYYPENFYSLPGLSLEVATSLLCANPDNDTNTCIELFNEENKDIYIKSQENIRGGVVLVNSKFEIDGRFKKILSSSQENYDELVYLDATNLYGYCLSDILPFANYTHVNSKLIERLNNVMSIKNHEQKMKTLEILLPDGDEMGYAFDIKILHVPKVLHEFPPFYGKKTIKADDISPADFYNYRLINNEEYCGKKHPVLIPLLNENDTTFSHYRMIKEAVKYGTKIEFLAGIKFQQKFLFKDYISLLAKLRTETDNQAHSKIFKLLANALYGKLLQSLFKYSKCRDFFFLEDGQNTNYSRIKEIICERHRSVKKKMFNDIKILDDDFIMVESDMINVEATNCPLLAFSILELAKLRNFSFFWKMKKFSPSTELIYCDTDSFILKINPNWYREMQPIKLDFDFSNAATKYKQLIDISYDEQIATQGVLGKYKSEICKNSILVAVIALQKKTYCLLSLTKVKCNQCQKWTALCMCEKYQGVQLFEFAITPHSKGKDLKQLNFLSYIDILLGKPHLTQTRHRFEQRNKQLKLTHTKYKSIVNFDDANYQLSCKIHNVPFVMDNHAEFICQKLSCKDAFVTLNLTRDFLLQNQIPLVYIKNGQLFLWNS